MNIESNLKFLKVLSEHNDKAWMDENRKWYETEKQVFEQFVAKTLAALTSINPAFASLQPKDCIFRLNRDIRFSKDKSPYKTNFGAAFAVGGKKSPAAGYYVHIQNDASFAGGGIWMPEAPILKKLRQEIDYNFDSFKSVIDHKNFKKYFDKIDGERLSRPPKGYEQDNPAIEYLKHKSYTVGAALSNKEVASNDLVAHCTAIFKAMTPFVDFLNTAID